MDCKTARLLLALGPTDWTELDEGEAAAFQAHLRECAQCAAMARSQREADERLREAMRDLPVPALPRERILRDIRRRQTRVMRRWQAICAAVACLVFGAGFGWQVWAKAHRPIVDTSADVEAFADFRGATPDVAQDYVTKNL